jgi:hypothetical protein
MTETRELLTDQIESGIAPSTAATLGADALHLAQITTEQVPYTERIVEDMGPKVLVCAFVEPQKVYVGQEFDRKDWPLHVTVVPWARREAPASEMVASLRETAHGIQPFEAAVNGQDHVRFVPSRGVNLLEGEPWKNLYDTFLPAVDQHANTRLARVYSGQSLPKGYRPHITSQSSGNVAQGDTFPCEYLYVVDKKPGVHGVRRVVGQLRLGDGPNDATS